MFLIFPFLLFVSLININAFATDTINKVATNCTDYHAAVNDTVFGSAVYEIWLKSLMNRVGGKGGWSFKHNDNDLVTFHSDESYWEIKVPGSPTEQPWNLEGVLGTFLDNHNNICYIYCVRIDHSGNWIAYVKMHYPNQDNGLKELGCTSVIHFTPACGRRVRKNGI
ncbi:hypothetical protein CANTEDRAFT_113645, partial [Yamadazyma tenuis ATCC 10573]